MHGESAALGNAISVPVMVAIRFSAPSCSANARASHTVSVRPGLTTRGAKDKSLAPRRRQQVGLELDGQDVGTRRHQREGRDAAGGVQRRP